MNKINLIRHLESQINDNLKISGRDLRVKIRMDVENEDICKIREILSLPFDISIYGVIGGRFDNEKHVPFCYLSSGEKRWIESSFEHLVAQEDHPSEVKRMISHLIYAE